jgi:hypothetical protein
MEKTENGKAIPGWRRRVRLYLRDIKIASRLPFQMGRNNGPKSERISVTKLLEISLSEIRRRGIEIKVERLN